VLLDYGSHNNRTLVVCQEFGAMKCDVPGLAGASAGTLRLNLLFTEVDGNKFSFMFEVEGQACPVGGPGWVGRVAVFRDA
jgi:hypothetical protein